MDEPRSAWTDDRLEHVLGSLLRVGVLLAAAVVLVGGIRYLVYYGTHDPKTSRVFQGNPPTPAEVPELNSFSGIFHWALKGHGRGMIQLGLVFLIATPLARVVFSAAAFVLQRDWIYVVVTLVVLAVLVYSLAWGQ